MRAVVATSTHEVRVEERPLPEPGPGEVLVEVASAGLNAADLAQVAGSYPPPPGFAQDALGLEFAGWVRALGPGVAPEAAGRLVMGITGGGAQAEFLTVPYDAVVPVPSALAPAVAGAMPEALFTAFDALVTQGGMGIGSRVLVWGALGGVGHVAVQMGALVGGQVTAVARSHDRDQELYSLGANQVVTPEELPDTGPYDVILELVSGTNLPTNVDLLAPGGRIVLIGLGNEPSATLDLRRLRARRGIVTGSTLRARSWHEKSLLASAIASRLGALLASGALRVLVDKQYPFEEAAEAYAYFARPGKVGKIVLVTAAEHHA
jgi:NADPH2:quinone reductase